VDLNLFKGQATQFGSSNAPGQVSEDAMQAVADEGQVESFTLVYPTSSNKFTGVNIYLDEIGMLKRLPLNKRAGNFALRAGFNPAPMFYGDIFMGRLTSKPVITNVDFKLGSDTSLDAAWLQRATMENLEYQTTMNSITGSDGNVQSAVDGEDGIAKAENNGLYTWTQTDEEIEIIVPLASSKASNSRDVCVNFYSKKITLLYKKDQVLSLDLYTSIDVDGCTWTLDRNSKETSVVITCEKSDAISWPRIKY